LLQDLEENKDPLSPFLFTLVLEVLARALDKRKIKASYFEKRKSIATVFR
jgi:hypothetical protein